MCTDSQVHFSAFRSHVICLKSHFQKLKQYLPCFPLFIKAFYFLSKVIYGLCYITKSHYWLTLPSKRDEKYYAPEKEYSIGRVYAAVSMSLWLCRPHLRLLVGCWWPLEQQSQPRSSRCCSSNQHPASSGLPTQSSHSLAKQALLPLKDIR